MLTFSDPQGFNQLKLRFCPPPKPLHEYACNPKVKTSPILLFGETLLWERSPVFSLLAAGNKSFLLPIFGLVVSFGSALTKRRIQYLLCAFFGPGIMLSFGDTKQQRMQSVNELTSLEQRLGRMEGDMRLER